MGGRGSKSGLNSGDSGKTSAKSATIVKFVVHDNGSDIDLKKSPLIYGDKDPNMTDAARKVVEEFEDKRWKNKIEYSRLVKEDGTIVEENKGGKGSVGASLKARLTADVLTHNHPGSTGEILSGTFSEDDITNFVTYNQTTYRATGTEGTYSISKRANFDGKGLIGYYSNVAKKSYANCKKKEKALEDKYIKTTQEAFDKATAAGNTQAAITTYVKTYEKARKAYEKGTNAAFNNYLVELHNALIANQGKYGYYYTLEGRAE